MKITIRKALPEDAYNYAMCHISCWQTAYKGIVSDEFLSDMRTKKEQQVEGYRKVLSEPGDCEYYCVLLEEEMIGFYIINQSRDESQSFIGEIWAVYLVEEFRGKGLGKEILAFAVDELKRVSPKEIFLWVLEDNNRARRFYEKNNFVCDGTKRETTMWGGPLTLVKYVLGVNSASGKHANRIRNECGI